LALGGLRFTAKTVERQAWKKAAKEAFGREAAGFERRVMRDRNTDRIKGVGAGNATYRPKLDGRYSVDPQYGRRGPVHFISLTMAYNNDILSKYKPLYAGALRRTLAWKDHRGVDWPEKDWFSRLGPCELLIKDISERKAIRAVLAVLQNHFANERSKKFYFIQEEALSGEPTRDYEHTVDNLNQIEGSELYESNFTAVLFDDRYTFALKLHNEGFGYFSGPEELCNALRQTQSLAPLIEDVHWQDAPSNN
jgi:hypothetical protein